MDLGASPTLIPGSVKLLADKGFFNCDGFLVLMGLYYEKAQVREGKLRVALMRTSKGLDRLSHIQGGPGPGGWWDLSK